MEGTESLTAVEDAIHIETLSSLLLACMTSKSKLEN